MVKNVLADRVGAAGSGIGCKLVVYFPISVCHILTHCVPTCSHLACSATPQCLHLVYCIEQTGLKLIVSTFHLSPETHVQAGMLVTTYQLLFRQHIVG